jgi:ATP-binding protein involved in chromosome partitioning
MAEKFDLPFLGQIPLIQGIREGGDSGEPVTLKKNQAGEAFKTVADNLVLQLIKRNANLEPTRVVEITKTREDFKH